MNRPKPYREYWDSCIFISLIEGHSERLSTLEAILDEAKKGRVEIYTSQFSIVEVAFAKSEKDGKALDSSIEAKINKLWLPSSPFKLVELHWPIFFDAQRLMRDAFGANEWSLKPADAIHVVTAQRIGADALHTYDEKLMRFSDLVGLTIETPRTDAILWPSDEESGEAKAGQ